MRLPYQKNIIMYNKNMIYDTIISNNSDKIVNYLFFMLLRFYFLIR